MHIEQKFMNALKLDSFKEINEKKFLDINGIVSKYTKLETGIEKLRVKYCRKLCLVPTKNLRKSHKILIYLSTANVQSRLNLICKNII